MRKLFIALIASALALGGQAYAQEGFSVGASVGYANIEFDDSSLTFDGSDTGYKIFGTWMFSENWGIEGGWVDMGTPDDTVLGIPVKIDVSGIDVFFVGSMPVADNFDLFGKAGMVSWDADFTIGDSEVGVESGSDDGEDLALGFGGRWKLGEQFGIRGEYEWFDISDADSVWVVSVGVDFFF
ncbi:MAG: porin family protein [Gammaproteobacteria bacterium]|nr:porin family protein [Gammaproteobacteria bacterium]MDH4255317.1 porin family protein [Gammaproteobacteria bacterium]MDH5273112.1 porin family protein [Gammaproteobacteria bacterium]